MKTVVHMVISDTWSGHLPAGGDRRRGLGTDFAFVCSSIKQGVDLANKLHFLTTGDHTQSPFSAGNVKRWVRAGTRRLAWSNDLKTHHIELLFDGEETQFNSSLKRTGEPDRA